MTKGAIFWVLMILALLFGGFVYWPHGGSPYWTLGNYLLQWVLFALLGWQVFGAAIK